MIRFGGNALAATLLIGIVFLMVFGCAYSNTDSTNGEYYSGAGSDWAWFLNTNNSITGNESTTSSSLLGSYQTAGSGFILSYINSVSGSVNPIFSGDTLAALEIPGFLFFVQPLLTTETQLLTNVSSNQCPIADYVANYIYTQFNSNDSMTNNARDYFGQYNVSVANGTLTTSNQYNMALSSVSTPTTFSGTCTNGTFSNAVTGYKVYSANNTALVKLLSPNTNAGDAFVGLPQAPIGALNNLVGSYNGYLYNSSDSSSIRFVQTSILPDTTTVSIYSVTTADYQTADDQVTVTLNLGTVDSPLPGMITGTIQLTTTSTTSGTANIACMGSANVVTSGKNAFLCIAQNPFTMTGQIVLALANH